MWNFIPIILYLTYGEAYHHPLAQHAVALNNEREQPTPYVYTNQPGGSLNTYNVPPKQYPDYDGPDPIPNELPDEYLTVPPYNKIPTSYYSQNGNDHQQSKPQYQSKPNFFNFENSSIIDIRITDSKSLRDGQSYFQDLELVESFGDYLKRRTQSPIDAGQQYNALVAVLVGLATAMRDTCFNFDKVYDQRYLSIVGTYYRHGLENPGVVAENIKDYIWQGKSHIPKLNKLKQELCALDPCCYINFDAELKKSPIFYAKELETLEALADLARSYVPYQNEFDLAARHGYVLSYFQNNQKKLKEFVMHIVNSVEHVTNEPVRCM